MLRNSSGLPISSCSTLSSFQSFQETLTCKDRMMQDSRASSRTGPKVIYRQRRTGREAFSFMINLRTCLAIHANALLSCKLSSLPTVGKSVLCSWKRISHTDILCSNLVSFDLLLSPTMSCWPSLLPCWSYLISFLITFDFKLQTISLQKELRENQKIWSTSTRKNRKPI